jgi:tetraacyldisaccharide 4'-kinase
VFAAVARLRNILYDKGILKSFEFTLPVILVGNLSTGGTGKTPHIEYLINLLKDSYKLATLSRGYGRKTIGFLMATGNSLVEDVGDEPKQYITKYKTIEVAVGEERLEAIPAILTEEPDTELVLMDDGFQHRKIIAGLNILLCSYHRPYFQDYVLPAGMLREPASEAKRARCIIVSKCPNGFSLEEKQQFLRKLKLKAGQQVFFSGLNYGKPYFLLDEERNYTLTKSSEVVLFCGIADPDPLRNYLISNASLKHEFIFRDHYHYSDKDLSQTAAYLVHKGLEKCVLICTEKDAMRLMELKEVIEKLDLKVVVLPVFIEFLFNEGKQFNEFIKSFIEAYIQENKPVKNE